MNTKIGISSLPNQRHRIVSRNGGKFTLMVVGASGLGKTTFINTLFSTLLKDYKSNESREIERTVSIDVVRADIEENGFNCLLSVIDTPGYGDYVNNSQCWIPIIEFIDDQYDAFMKREATTSDKSIDDLRIHACLYFIQPSGHTLSSLDIQVMKELGSRCNLIPVIAKGDTITHFDAVAFKARILDVIAINDIQIYRPPIDDESDGQAESIIAAMPFSVIASEHTYQVNGKECRGRQYVWGIAQVENELHCDFQKLRNLLIRTHMYDLITSTSQVHYESHRSNLLKSKGFKDEDVIGVQKSRTKIDEEGLRQKFTEQVRHEEARFRKWEQNLMMERDRLNKDLEDHHRLVKELEHDVEEMSNPTRVQ